jgi:hypothetical protein
LKFHHAESNRMSVYEIEIDGRVAHVVYDKRTKGIATVKPPDGSPDWGAMP